VHLKLLKGLRIFAILIGGLFTFLFLSEIIRHIILEPIFEPELRNLDPTIWEVLGLLSVVTYIIAYFLTFWFPRWGGWQMIASGIIFGLSESIDNRSLDAPWFIYVFIVVGIIFIMTGKPRIEQPDE
jgi:hypothetical protein